MSPKLQSVNAEPQKHLEIDRTISELKKLFNQYVCFVGVAQEKTLNTDLEKKFKEFYPMYVTLKNEFESCGKVLRYADNKN